MFTGIDEPLRGSANTSTATDDADMSSLLGLSPASIRRFIELPLDNGTTPRLCTFDGLADGRDDHFSLQFGANGGENCGDHPPLVRLHSSCVSGDIFGSQRCDCGPQLQEALRRCAQHGGVILYLMQEGRGVGFASKIDSYALQSAQGLDTFEANRALGFADDLRDYRVAAQMLLALGLHTIRLLTNNPDKASQLERHGICVACCESTGVFLSHANRRYLQAKQAHGHRFVLEPLSVLCDCEG
jgi:GTP cyclohydrolase II